MANRSLDVLNKKRPTLLMAEIAAWLHMLGKYYEKFLTDKSYATKLPDDLQESDSELGELLRGDWLGNILVEIDELEVESLSINHLIESHADPDAETRFERLMWDAHGRGSGLEKGALNRFAPPQEDKVYMSSAVGFETEPVDTEAIDKQRHKKLYPFLQKKLEELKKNKSQVAWTSFRDEFIDKIKTKFQATIADSRRPMNDVTLFDQTAASVALFKAALAQNLLEGWQEPNPESPKNRYRWRILRIGLNGPAYWGQAARINDMLSRKDLIDPLLNAIRAIIEDTYPLGMEIYRGENGSLFIMPDIDNLLDFVTDGQTLRERIQKQAEDFSKGEIRFSLEFQQNGSRNMQRFGEMATADLPAPMPSVKEVKGWWHDSVQSINRQVCTVCGLRPQGPDSKALERNVCDICEERRDDRSKKWAKKLKNKSVWLDEVADINGRFALIVGKFGIEAWLMGNVFNSIPMLDLLKHPTLEQDGLEFSYNLLLAECKNALADPNQTLGKKTKILKRALPPTDRLGVRKYGKVYTHYLEDSDLIGDMDTPEAWRFSLSLMRQKPSPARIRRVWETTRKFWQDVQQDFKPPERRAYIRLEIRGELHPAPDNQPTPGDFHAMELDLGKTRLNVVWDPDTNGGRFITADNLDYVAKLLEKEEGQDTLVFLKEKISGRLTVLEPLGYGSESKVWGQFTVAESYPATISDSEYTPIIPILAEPRTFMALVPAKKALDYAMAIKEKYEREMGKVLNRLPLRLGIVYAHHRMPLRAILDAGQRMLSGENLHPENWVVEKINDGQDEAEDENLIQELAVTLSRKNRQVDWRIPLCMGDGSKDVWYPYVYVLEPQEDHPIEERKRYFWAPCPWNEQNRTPLVHAEDLKKGDIIYFTPACLDFQWLDSAARRFDLAYNNDDGSRRGLLRRPYLFSELNILAEIWATLTRHLTINQIHILRDLIEDKRETWKIEDGQALSNKTFLRFCRQAIINAQWKNKVWSQEEQKLDDWAEYAARGWISDAVRLHLHIMKAENTLSKEVNHG